MNSYIRISLEAEKTLLAILDRTGPDGLYIKKQVGIIAGKIKVLVNIREHSPPHFHIQYNDLEASITIRDCQWLTGDPQMRRYLNHTKAWWNNNKTELIKVWNETRPYNCPVGPIENTSDL